MNVLEVVDISKRFDGVEAVSSVSFAAKRGEILGLLGPNGAGKTTTIRMIMGIIRPDSGDIQFLFNGMPATINKCRVGYLPEERGLYDDARVLDTLVYFAELKGMPRFDARVRALAWLERLDLSSWATRKVEALSKGMQQKVQFLAAILHRPGLVVLDEPFSGLDPVNQDLFKEIISVLKRDGMTILLSSHQMNRVEELCDRIFLIDNGRCVLYGELDGIKQAHGEHAVKLRFSGDPAFLAEDERIRALKLSDDRALFVLRKGVDPDSFIRDIPSRIVIREISVERPALHDIFVDTIKGGGDEPL